MKKALYFLLAILLLSALTLPVTAEAGEAIVFTSDSSFDVGGTVKVDKGKTFDIVMNKGSSEEYNAFLEGNVQYYWMRNGAQHAEGMTLKLTELDRGCQIYCIAALYSDADRTQQCGTITSAKFTVPKADDSALYAKILTKSLPQGTVGKAYRFKLECSDPDAVFSLLRTSLPDGLNLTQHGEIEGTPTKAGAWRVAIVATPEAGPDYIDSVPFDLIITEASVPEKTTVPADSSKPDVTTSSVSVSAEAEQKPTVTTKETETPSDALTTGAIEKNEETKASGIPWWGILLVAAAAASAGAAITLLLLKRKK